MVMICLIVWWRNENLSVRSYEVWPRALHSLILTNLLLWVIWCWYPGGFDSLTTLPLDTTSYSFFITFLLVWKTWFSTLIVNTWTLLILLILKWNHCVFFPLKGRPRDKKRKDSGSSRALIKVILCGQWAILSFELPCFLWEKGPHFSLTFLHEKHFFFMYLHLNLFLELYEAILIPLSIRLPQIICIILCSQPNLKSRLEVLMFIFYLFVKIRKRMVRNQTRYCHWVKALTQ